MRKKVFVYYNTTYSVFNNFSANLQAICTMIDKDTLGKHMQYIETGLRHQILKVKVTKVNLYNQGDHQS